MELGVPGCNYPPPILGRKMIKTFSLERPSIIVCTPNFSDFPSVLTIHLFKQKDLKSLFLIFVHDIHSVFVATQLLYFHYIRINFCTLHFTVFEFIIPYQEKILPNARKTIKYKLVLIYIGNF